MQTPRNRTMTYLSEAELKLLHNVTARAVDFEHSASAAAHLAAYANDAIELATPDTGATYATGVKTETAVAIALTHENTMRLDGLARGRHGSRSTMLRCILLEQAWRDAWALPGMNVTFERTVTIPAMPGLIVPAEVERDAKGKPRLSRSTRMPLFKAVRLKPAVVDRSAEADAYLISRIKAFMIGNDEGELFKARAAAWVTMVRARLATLDRAASEASVPLIDVPLATRVPCGWLALTLVSTIPPDDFLRYAVLTTLDETYSERNTL